MNRRLRPRKHVLLVSALLLFLCGIAMTGCSSGGSGGPTVQAPTSLTYAQSTISATLGTPITADSPTVNGTSPTFSVSPALPAGITLNASTGVISGTPSTASPATTYTITAVNSAGSVTASLSITVTAPPSALTYPQTTISAATGTAITADTPTYSGSAATFSISPTLPAGLTINTSTGAISGTPTAASVAANYTVTATNSAGSTTTTVNITVTTPPSALVYPQTTIAATTNIAITTDTPTVSGTAPTFSISPALPTGLSFSTTTGAISGTPTALAPAANYTVTATNAAGSTTATLSISVSAPSAPTISFPSTQYNLTLNTSFSAITPTVTGATPITVSITPTLPSGLGITPSGSITGLPLATAGPQAYVVTATNSLGSASTTIVISVSSTTVSLTYPNSISAAVGDLIPSSAPSISGNLTSFSISPALPAGLTLDPATGIISGSPTAVSPQATYTVTASGPSGPVTGSILIGVASPRSVIDLGLTADVKSMAITSNRLLSTDGTRWVLNDLSAGTIVADGAVGASPANYTYFSASLAGSIVVVDVPGAVDIRSATDGHLLRVISSPVMNQYAYISNTGTGTILGAPVLSTDGSYIAVAAPSGLFLWSTSTGHLLFSEIGDYSSANIMALPARVEIALGAAGKQVIENISTSTFTRTVTPAFNGTFTAWFADGSSFITNFNSSANYIYSADAVQELITSYFGISGGTGDHYFAPGPLNSYTLLAYRLSTNTLQATLPNADGGYLIGANALAVFSSSISGNPQITFYDPSTFSSLGTQSAANPLGFTSYVINKLAVYSSSIWANTYSGGVVVDHPSGLPRILTLGAASSIAGTSARAAVCVASGKIFQIDPTLGAVTGNITTPCYSLGLTPDGNTLAATSPSSASVYALPAGSITSTTSAVSGQMQQIQLSPSGSTIVFSPFDNDPTGYSSVCYPIVWNVGGTTWHPSTSTNWCYSGMSPDETRFGFGTGALNESSVIYTGQTLSATSSAMFVGWLDNTHFLGNTYQMPFPHTAVFQNAAVYDNTGTQTATSGLGDVRIFTPIDANTIYIPAANKVQSISSGSVLWKGSFNSGVGALAGTWVVYQANGHIYEESR